MNGRLRARHFAVMFGATAPAVRVRLTATTVDAIRALPDRDNGRRRDVNTRVVGGVSGVTGDANGDTGRLASSSYGRQYGRQYGRWEARVRSRATDPDRGGRQYHPPLILWPDSGEHPQGGEQRGEVFPRHPHPVGVPVQQAYACERGVDLSRWHNGGVGWTPNHPRGFIDGEDWFRFSGGANADRQRIQCAPSTHARRLYDLPDNESVR